MILFSNSDDEDKFEHLAEVRPGDEIFDISCSAPDEDVTEDDIGGIDVVNCPEDVIKDTGVVAYPSCLVKLAQTKLPKVCSAKRCGRPVNVESKQSGTYLILTWVSFWM